jgi:zinc transporter ZupT
VNIVLAALAGTGFALAGMAGMLGVHIGRPIRALSVAVASGILLAISFAELFPEALEVAGHERAVFGFLLGFGALFMIEVLTRAHTHHDQDDATAHVHADCEDDHHHHHSHTLWPFIIGLALHNLVDGFAIGASADLSEDAAGAVAIGVLVHQIPVGISFAAVLAAAAASRAVVVRSAIALGLAIVAGALAVAALPEMSHESLAVMGAAAAGALAYIGAGHLLPEAHRERASVIIGTAFPLSLLLTAWLFLRVLPHE